MGRRGRRDDAWRRAGARRSDRRGAGRRRGQQRDRRELVQRRRHARRLDRPRLLELEPRTRDLFVLLSRPDPARLLARREPRRTGHRAPCRAASGAGAVSAADLGALQRPQDRRRRRRAVNRGMELLAWLAAAVAVGFLVLVVWSVAKRGVSQLNLDLLTK